MAIRPGGRALSSQIDSVACTGFMGITNIRSIQDGTVKVSENWSLRNGTTKVSELWSLRNGTVKVSSGTVNIPAGNLGTVKVSNVANGTVRVPEVWSLRNGTVKTTVGTVKVSNLASGTVKVSENWSLRNGTTKVSELWSLRNGTVKTTVGTVKVSNLANGTAKVSELWSLRNGTVKGGGGFMNLAGGTVKVSALAAGTLKVSELWSLRNGTAKISEVWSVRNATVKQATRSNLLMKPEREDLLTKATQFVTGAAADVSILAAVAAQSHKIYACGYDISSNVRGRFRWATSLTRAWGTKRNGGVYAQSFPNPIVGPSNTILNFRAEGVATCEVWCQYITEA